MSAEAQPPIEAQGHSGSGLAGLLGSVISAGKGILARRRQAAAELPARGGVAVAPRHQVKEGPERRRAEPRRRALVSRAR